LFTLLFVLSGANFTANVNFYYNFNTFKYFILTVIVL
jgi:hypothetical protein